MDLVVIEFNCIEFHCVELHCIVFKRTNGSAPQLGWAPCRIVSRRQSQKSRASERDRVGACLDMPNPLGEIRELTRLKIASTVISQLAVNKSVESARLLNFFFKDDLGVVFDHFDGLPGPSAPEGSFIRRVALDNGVDRFLFADDG